MSRILLTGGAGFIGSHLAERLIMDGHSLFIVDDLNDFYSPLIKRKNLAGIRLVGNYEFMQADIGEEEPLREIFHQFSPEVIVHLAARAGVRPSLEQPNLYERVNVQGTLNLLELARTGRISKFIFASSSSIYGITSRVPFSEDEANPNPISPYGVTKLAGEKLCYCYAHLYHLPVVCLRFFTVYGPRQRPDLAIHKFARFIEEHKPIPFFGDGSARRDYTYIADIVDGILAAIEFDTDFGIFNLGNSRPISLEQLIGHLEAALGEKAILDRQPAQPGDMPVTYADIRRAEQRLGYHPRFSIEKGLEKIVGWLRKSNQGSNG
jgi:UDP-glucuronate 4-epimerase